MERRIHTIPLTVDVAKEVAIRETKRFWAGRGYLALRAKYNPKRENFERKFPASVFLVLLYVGKKKVEDKDYCQPLIDSYSENRYRFN